MFVTKDATIDFDNKTDVQCEESRSSWVSMEFRHAYFPNVKCHPSWLGTVIVMTFVERMHAIRMEGTVNLAIICWVLDSLSDLSCGIEHDTHVYDFKEFAFLAYWFSGG
eukprot:698921_1